MRTLILGLLMGMILAGAARGDEAALALKDREINLLKQRLRQAETGQRENSLARMIAETQVHVAALREFRIARLVTSEPLTQEVIDRLIDKALEGMYPGPKLGLYTWGRQVFGALPEGVELHAFYKNLIGEQAGGRYDPERKVLYVNPNFKLEGTLGSIILAHEICHALQDQNFNLNAMGLDDAENADRSLVTLCLAEGDATLLMSEYMAAHGNMFNVLRDLPQMLMIDQTQLNRAPAAVREEMLFPYLSGAAFFKALGGRTRQNPERHVGEVARQGWRSEVFLAPPDSTEQILHPEKYLTGELPDALPEILSPPGTTTIQTTVGEFGVAALLLEGVDRGRAFAAAEGWNGDRMLLSEDGAGMQRALTWHTRWDTPQDADEFAAALPDALVPYFGKELAWKERRNGRDATARGATLRIAQPNKTQVELEIRMPSIAQAGETEPE